MGDDKPASGMYVARDLREWFRDPVMARCESCKDK